MLATVAAAVRAATGQENPHTRVTRVAQRVATRLQVVTWCRPDGWRCRSW
jgi:hypothetical protein